MSVKDKQTLDVPVWAGVAFHATDSRLHFGHLIWHLFVMAGTTCHYFAVRWHAARTIPSDEDKPTAPAFARPDVSAFDTGGMSATRR